jgi:hypothetical protein
MALLPRVRYGCDTPDPALTLVFQGVSDEMRSIYEYFRNTTMTCLSSVRNMPLLQELSLEIWPRAWKVADGRVAGIQWCIVLPVLFQLSRIGFALRVVSISNAGVLSRLLNYKYEL